MDDVQRASARASEAVARSSRASDLIDDAVQAEEDKPVRCAKFRQQELWAWKPVWSPRVVVIMYLIVAVIFVPLGVVVFIQSTRLSNTSRLRYDNDPQCDVGAAVTETTEKVCLVPVTIDKNITAPAFLYYGLVNFYQNARTYVSSRSDTQLRGEDNPDISECEPLETRDGATLDPCGLVANSQFNDSFEICNTRACEDDDKVVLGMDDISWEIDRTKRFLSSDNRSPEENKRVTSEAFMVWMRLSAYRNWKKLFARIESDMPAGTYYMRITSRFPVESFDGEKFFFISETTWFGGPNEILGIAYMVVGGLALVLAIAVAIRSRVTPVLDLPPQTSVLLDGIVADSELPKLEGESQEASA